MSHRERRDNNALTSEQDKLTADKLAADQAAADKLAEEEAAEKKKSLEQVAASAPWHGSDPGRPFWPSHF